MQTTNQWWQQHQQGLSVWKTADLTSDKSWVHHIAAGQLAALRATIDSGFQITGGRVPEKLCLLPGWEHTLGAARNELYAGRGIFLLRRLSMEVHDTEKYEVLLLGLASHLGNLAAQNATGDIVRRVMDVRGESTDTGQARGHRGRAEMEPHSDSADVVGLYCLNPAKHGGETYVCSSAALFNEIRDHRPEFVPPLRNGFHFDLTGKTARGFSERRLPVFAFENERLSCHFNKNRIEAGMARAGLPFTASEQAALEYLNRLAMRPDLSFRFQLQAGDLLFLNNNAVLHGRESFEDWPEVGRKRLLLRVWLNQAVMDQGR